MSRHKRLSNLSRFLLSVLVTSAFVACEQQPAFHEVAVPQSTTKQSEDAVAIKNAQDEFQTRQQVREHFSRIIEGGEADADASEQQTTVDGEAPTPPNGEEPRVPSERPRPEKPNGPDEEEKVPTPRPQRTEVPRQHPPEVVLPLPPVSLPTVPPNLPLPVPTAVAVPTSIAIPVPTHIPTALPLPSPVPTANVSPTPQVTQPPAATPTPEDPVVTLPPVTNPCADTARTHRVLILDFKSGWFAGDGGEFFKQITQTECNSTMQIAYIHFTTQKIESNLDKIEGGSELLPCLQGKGSKVYETENDVASCAVMGSFAHYDELWVLSGSQYDNNDILPWGTQFNNIKARAVELKNANPRSGFFFGAGLSNNDHANIFAHDLFPDIAPVQIFSDSEGTFRGTFPSTKFPQFYGSKPLIAGNGKAKGSFDKTFQPFSDLKSIFDYPKSKNRYDLGQCFADGIHSSKVETVATDHCGEVAIARATSSGHKIVFDGNMARFYGTKPPEYFHRLLMYLMAK